MHKLHNYTNRNEYKSYWYLKSGVSNKKIKKLNEIEAAARSVCVQFGLQFRALNRRGTPRSSYSVKRTYLDVHNTCTLHTDNRKQEKEMDPSSLHLLSVFLYKCKNVRKFSTKLSTLHFLRPLMHSALSIPALACPVPLPCPVSVALS